MKEIFYRIKETVVIFLTVGALYGTIIFITQRPNLTSSATALSESSFKAVGTASKALANSVLNRNDRPRNESAAASNLAEPVSEEKAAAPIPDGERSLNDLLANAPAGSETSFPEEAEMTPEEERATHEIILALNQKGIEVSELSDAPENLNQELVATSVSMAVPVTADPITALNEIARTKNAAPSEAVKSFEKAIERSASLKEWSESSVTSRTNRLETTKDEINPPRNASETLEFFEFAENESKENEVDDSPFRVVSIETEPVEFFDFAVNETNAEPIDDQDEVVVADVTSKKETSDSDKAVSETTDVQTTDVQTTDVQTTDVQTTDIQTTDIQTADIQTADIQTTDIQTTDIQTTDIQTADIQTTVSEMADSTPVVSEPVEFFDFAVNETNAEPIAEPIDGQDEVVVADVTSEKETSDSDKAVSETTDVKTTDIQTTVSEMADSKPVISEPVEFFDFAVNEPNAEPIDDQDEVVVTDITSEKETSDSDKAVSETTDVKTTDIQTTVSEMADSKPVVSEPVEFFDFAVPLSSMSEMKNAATPENREASDAEPVTTPPTQTVLKEKTASELVSDEDEISVVVSEPVEFFDYALSEESETPILSLSLPPLDEGEPIVPHETQNEEIDFFDRAVGMVANGETNRKNYVGNNGGEYLPSSETGDRIGEKYPVSEPSDIDATEPESETLPLDPLENQPSASCVFRSAIRPVSANMSSENVSATALDNELWLVSSENICGNASDSAQQLSFWREESGAFQTSDLDRFLANESKDVSTIVLIHGNLSDRASALHEGLLLKNRLVQIQQKNHLDVPFRLVIWKWASERTFGRIRPDSQYKAGLADENGLYLADFLTHLPAQSNVTLVGFSFGVRTGGSALELLGGGSVNGHAIPAEKKASRSQMTLNFILLAGAANYCDLGRGGKYSFGASILSNLLNVYNPADKALRFYPLLYHGGGPSAMGVAPINPATLPETLRDHAWSVNSSYLGPEHRFENILSAVEDRYLAGFVFNIW